MYVCMYLYTGLEIGGVATQNANHLWGVWLVCMSLCTCKYNVLQFLKHDVAYNISFCVVIFLKFTENFVGLIFNDIKNYTRNYYK